MSHSLKVMLFLANQEKIDQEVDISDKAFKANPDLYRTAWRDYIARTEQNVERFKTELNYFESLSEENEEIAKYKSSLSKMRLGSARTYITRARSGLSKSQPNRFYPHFRMELDAIREASPEYAKYFKDLDTSSPAAFDKSIGILVSHGVPRDVTRQLNQLPFKHPALNTLRLTSTQYAELTKQAKADKQLSHENAPIAYLSEVWDFVVNAYQDRHQDPDDYATPFIALEFSLGRRSVELAMLSEITLSPIPGHLRVIGLAKQRSKKTIIDIPVVILKPEQALELFKLARERAERIVFGHRMEKLAKIKETRDTLAFGQIFKKLRTEFKKHFNFARLKKSPRLRGEATMHTATRAIYLHLVIKIYATHPIYKNLSPIAIANKILAHMEGDYDTTLAYFDMNIIDDLNDGRRSKFKSKPEPQESQAIDKPKAAPKKAPTAKPHSKAKAASSDSSDDRKFFIAVRKPKLMVAAAEYAKKKRNQGIIKIHTAMLFQFKEKPTMLELQQIAGEKAAKEYVKFLEIHDLAI